VLCNSSNDRLFLLRQPLPPSSDQASPPLPGYHLACSAAVATATQPPFDLMILMAFTTLHFVEEFQTLDLVCLCTIVSTNIHSAKPFVSYIVCHYIVSLRLPRDWWDALPLGDHEFGSASISIQTTRWETTMICNDAKFYCTVLRSVGESVLTSRFRIQHS
jgi:hypothetical protein